jgi:hypothetical protein
MHFRKLVYCAILFAVVLLIVQHRASDIAAAPAPNDVYDPEKATASVTGKVMFEGKRPSPVELAMTPDCVQAHNGPGFDEIITVNENNALKDVFIYVKEGAEKWTYSVPTQPVLFDQIGCHYVPHIVGVMVNQPFEIINNDPIFHNVHSMPTKNQPFNHGMPLKGMKVTKTLDTPEVIPVKCDIHRWMSSYIHVVENPFYAVSAADGSFAIKNLPAGTFTLEAWHEKLGTQIKEVTLTSGKSQEVTFTFKES